MGMFEILLRVAKPPTYGVHYTSTDGETVTPHDVSAFGLSVLLDNTYSGGVGTFVLDSRATMINTDAFSGCSTLLGIDLNGITTIGARAFRFTAITEIELPSTLTSIGKEAFYHAGSLTDVTVLAETPPTLGTNAFASTLQHIYVPADKVSTYKSTTGWSYFASIIEPIGGAYHPINWIDVEIHAHITSSNLPSANGFGLGETGAETNRSHGTIKKTVLAEMGGTVCTYGTGALWNGVPRYAQLELTDSLIPIPHGTASVSWQKNSQYDLSLFVREPYSGQNSSIWYDEWLSGSSGTSVLPSTVTDGNHYLLISTKSGSGYDVGSDISDVVNMKVRFNY